MAVKITCINKDNGHHEDPHMAITHLDWLEEATGKHDKCTRMEMVEFIRDKKGVAYVVGGYGLKAYLEVKRSSHGTWFVRTIPDGTTDNNLLKLPECR